MNRLAPYFLCLLVLASLSCDDDKDDLSPAEDRRSESVENLRDLLTAPANGWRLDYQPNPGSGVYFMILQFDEDGTVRIQSDLAANDGEFFDQTISYRIDAILALELIFETYGPFHYLFELQQATFGAEFEYLFLEEADGNLVFESKTDPGNNKTVITLTPASAADLGAFSVELAENLQAFAGQSPRLFGGVPPSQQLYLSSQDISIFWSIDLTSRLIDVSFAGAGASVDEILGNGSKTAINHSTGFVLQNGLLQLVAPFTTTVNGESITVSTVQLTDFSMTGASLCDSTTDNTPVYAGTIADEGPVVVTKSLINGRGDGFTPQTNSFYAVNIPFVFDADFNSLAEEGSIAEHFPGAVGFMMTYGFQNDSIPAYSVGLIVEDENKNVHYYLRSFQMTTSKSNEVSIDLLDDFYFSTIPGPEDQQHLAEITDEIFYGGKVYAYDLGLTNLTAFQFYNPCNGYEFVLVK